MNTVEDIVKAYSKKCPTCGHEYRFYIDDKALSSWHCTECETLMDQAEPLQLSRVPEKMEGPGVAPLNAEGKIYQIIVGFGDRVSFVASVPPQNLEPVKKGA